MDGSDPGTAEGATPGADSRVPLIDPSDLVVSGNEWLPYVVGIGALAGGFGRSKLKCREPVEEPTCAASVLFCRARGQQSQGCQPPPSSHEKLWMRCGRININVKTPTGLAQAWHILVMVSPNGVGAAILRGPNRCWRNLVQCEAVEPIAGRAESVYGYSSCAQS